eukprot:GFUD01014052.1.p1 GENE.GFUD01014052.1~~GFUD01014052.1.p1  ORF type:complete len:661 (+),score=162.12 GFUD01014052.1:81-2063(+)
MQNWRQKGRQGSVWNLFQNKTNINNDLKNILDEVVAVRKVCMSSRASMLEMLQIKTSNTQGRTSEIQKKESIYWKTGENLLLSEKELKHSNSPLKEILSGMGNFLQSVSEDHARFESDIQATLGPDKTIHNLITKDYPNMQKDKDCLRKKQKEQENVESRYTKEKQRRELAADDVAFEEHHFAKEVKLKDELENITRETASAEDKFTTTLYCLQAKEKELAANLVETLKSLQKYFNKVLNKVNENLPKLEEIVINSSKTKTYGEDLENHLRVQKLKIALPLQIGVEGLRGKLKEEGLFRVSPSIPSLKKMKASIDAGIPKREILRKYKDPHLYTSAIKYFLRELPDPLLCSEFLEDWKAIDNVKDELERMKRIKELIEKLPDANKNNIAFLFHFLSKLVDEEFYNKMSIENIIVVLSPNLLWDTDGTNISIDNVYKSMIEHYELILEDPESLTTNPYEFITNNTSLASQESDDCIAEIDDVVGEMKASVTDNEAFIIEKRSSVHRSAIKENRKNYQDRSFSGDFKRSSMENLELNLEEEDQTNYTEKTEQVAEISTRKSTRKKSKSFDEDTHKAMLPFVRTYSISSKPPYSKIENMGSSSDPILHSPALNNKSCDSIRNSSPPPLKRNSTVSQAVMSRIPKMSFHMPKRNAKSVDPKFHT